MARSSYRCACGKVLTEAGPKAKKNRCYECDLAASFRDKRQKFKVSRKVKEKSVTSKSSPG